MRSIPEILPSVLIRFWSKVDKQSDSECWNWIGSNDSNYGEIRINNRNYKAHRLSYCIHYNEDPGEFLVCHECNNKLCVNPNHLFLGTDSDNLQHSFDTNVRSHQGSLHPKARLLDSNIQEIRDLQGTLSERKIARLFNVGRGTIRAVLSGKTWAHVKS